MCWSVNHAPLMNQPPANHAILTFQPTPSIPLLRQHIISDPWLDASSSICFAVWTAQESAGQRCWFLFFSWRRLWAALQTKRKGLFRRLAPVGAIMLQSMGLFCLARLGSIMLLQSMEKKGLFRRARIPSITSVVKSLWRISDQGAYSLKVFGKALSTSSLLQLVKLITLECLLLPQLLCVPGIFALLMQALQPLGV